MWTLLAIVTAYAVAQFVIVGVHHYWGWDEAIYYAKASTRVADVSWGPVRSLGLPWLMWPATAFGGGVVAVRSWLLGIESLALLAAFAPWVWLVRWGAVIGAALFAGSWLALFFGPAAYPNLPASLAVVAATGWLLLALHAARAWPAYCAAVLAFGVAATIRPVDALVQFAGVALVLVVAHRARAARALLAGVGGLAIGWLVWTVEAYQRFGGPLQRWRDGARFVEGRALRPFLYTTAITRPNAALTTPRVVFALLWWTTIAACAVAGVVASRGTRRVAVAAGIAAALASLVQYLAYPSDNEARFLIPIYASLAVPMGVGVYAVVTAGVRRRGVRLVPAVALVGVLGVLLAWHVDSTRITVRFARARGAATQAIGRYVRQQAGGRPCVVGTDENTPVLEVASGCRATRVRVGTATTLPASLARPTGGVRRYLVGQGPPPPGSPVRGWQVTTIQPQPGTTVFVYEPPAGG